MTPTDRLVVIGGSAGSLAAMQSLFQHLRKGCGFACLVIQHMSPDHASHLDDLVAKHTDLPVSKLTEATEPLADHVYIGVAGRYPLFDHGRLSCRTDDEVEPRHHPIDRFCRSLPAGVAAKATLVVLSGTGDDGTEGAAAIKRANGRVIVQAPIDCAFPAMPASVLQGELADLVLPAAEIGTLLASSSDAGAMTSGVGKAAEEEDLSGDYDALLQLVMQYSKQDMSVYKPTTLRRRIHRRMGLHHLESLAQYLHLLRHNQGELDRLSKDLLIGVTGFFRDADAFAVLREQAVPRLCRDKDEGEAVRVWVAGCSTGEEVYSIAMLFLDWFRDNDHPPALQIFATDIDNAALDVARAGVYPAEALANVDPGLVPRYFSEEKACWRINKAVRETVVFASHNLISDPPFSKLDLVVCRNLLIYLNQVNQRKLLSLFHFVLKPGGCLFLGSSENIGNVARHFHPLSKQWRIFVHTDGAPRRPPLLPLSGGLHGQREGAGPVVSPGGLTGHSYFRQLIESFGPTQALINAKNQLLYVSGDPAPYLTVPVGQPSHDLFKLVRPEFSTALRSAVSMAQEDRQRVAVSVNLPARQDGESGAVRLEVTPIRLNDGQLLLLVGFSPEPASHSSQSVNLGGDDWVLQQLVQELNATREDLQRTIDQSRTATEEMRAAHEEVMAMNEELQSANEELESSKEELQSLNEELSTANSELDAKVAEVEALNADLTNLLVSSESATLLLDNELRIRHFTPACTRLMRIIATDLGRHIDDVVRLYNDPDLIADCRSMLRGLAAPDREIKSDEDRWYLRRILPYRHKDGELGGVVLDFTDVTDIKRADDLLRERADVLQWQSDLLSRAAPVVGRDLSDRIIFWNKGAEALYDWTEQEAIGQEIHQLLRSQFPKPLEQIKTRLFDKGSWKGEITHLTRSGTSVTVDSQWTLYRDAGGEAAAIVEVINDISERKQAQAELRDQETMFHTMVDWTYNWEYWLDPAGAIVYMTPSAEALTGYTAEEFVATPSLLDFIVEDADRHLWEQFLRCDPQTGGQPVKELRLRIRRKNGERCWIHLSCRPVVESDGRFLGLRLTARDITDQIKADEQIRNLAYFDPLTGLPNRRLLMDRLGQGLIASQRSREYGALLLIDLDRFKEINDTQGHEMGDQLLRETARRLDGSVRKEDTVARLGGDEFVVQLDNLSTDEQQAAGKAEKIAETVRQALNHCFNCDEGQSEYLNSCSIGITLFLGTDSSVEILLKQADLAMYQAKDAGRNAIRFFNPAMQAAIDRRIALITGLRQGLDHQEFSLHYQPQYDVSGQPVGAEALVRWDRPGQGLTLPAGFIPLAEETGFILPLGQWVLDTAVAQLKAWESQGGWSGLSLSVNVSPRQFLQKDFVSQLAASLERGACRADRLVLEITENLVLASLEKVQRQMNQLKSLGVGFALDDFGTGHSALYYLKQLPFNQLKIDRSFVRDIHEDPNDAAIVRAILAMSRSLGLETVAEGVETREQLDYLVEHGCTMFQGYLFAKPMPIANWPDKPDPSPRTGGPAGRPPMG